jgi:hypothetical protein
MFESWSGHHLFNDLRVIEYPNIAFAPYLPLRILGERPLFSKAVGRNISADMERYSPLLHMNYS